MTGLLVDLPDWRKVPTAWPACGLAATFGPDCTAADAAAGGGVSITTKVVPELVRTEVRSRVVLPEVMLIARDCHPDALMAPETPLIVAEALVKVTDPKFAKLVVPLTEVASTIHSAEVRWARGLWVCDEDWYVPKESLAWLWSLMESSNRPAV